VAPSNVAEAILTYRPELNLAMDLTVDHPVGWAVRANSPKLLAAVNDFLAQHYQIRADSTLVRSEFYNVLHKKYFSDRRLIRRREEDPFRLARTGRLSPYDELFRQAAQRYGFDWRLIASVAFQESRFDPQQRSWAGAVGLMQLRPRTADVSEDSLLIPAVNVELGVRHLRDLYDSFDYLEPEERLDFALAAYNAGQGHLEDARILSIVQGRDPNQWEGSVRESLLLLRKPDFHRQVRYGYVRGTETVAYVHDILRRYDLFCQLMRERPPLPVQFTFDGEVRSISSD